MDVLPVPGVEGQKEEAGAEGGAVYVPKSKDDDLAAAIPLPLSQRWKKWVVRTITTWTLIGVFALIVNQGPVAISVTIVGLQFLAFREVVSIGYAWNQEKHLPLFRVQQWYFLFVALFLLYGRNTLVWGETNVWGGSEATPNALLWVRDHYTFVAFCAWALGLVVVVLTLHPQTLRYQLAQFALTHMCLLLVVFPIIFVVRNTFNGLFWFLLPSTLIFVNDITAYMWGFHFGKTPLIQLSPKKTWEGFIGGGFCTLLWGFYFPLFLVKYGWIICPRAAPECAVSWAFLPREYSFSIGETDYFTTTLLPVQFHGLFLAVFASVVAPFGGFFASGVKRAYKLKDFANLLPGHGGIIDRVDCQFLMALFTYTFYINFVERYDPSVQEIVATLRNLSAGDFAAVASAMPALCNSN